MSTNVIQALTPEALQQARIIQEKVFAVEQDMPSSLVHDGADAIFVLAVHDGKAVATGRLQVEEEEKRQGIIARIAVLPSNRGRGLGKLLVKRLETLARSKGLTKLVLNPHSHLEAFYANMGYETMQDSQHCVAGPSDTTYSLLQMTKQLV